MYHLHPPFARAVPVDPKNAWVEFRRIWVEDWLFEAKGYWRLRMGVVFEDLRIAIERPLISWIRISNIPQNGIDRRHPGFSLQVFSLRKLLLTSKAAPSRLSRKIEHDLPRLGSKHQRLN